MLIYELRSDVKQQPQTKLLKQLQLLSSLIPQTVISQGRYRNLQCRRWHFRLTNLNTEWKEQNAVMCRRPTLTKSMYSTFCPPDNSFKSVGETVIPSETGGGLGLGLGADLRGLPMSSRCGGGAASMVRALSALNSFSGNGRPLGDSWAGGVLDRFRKSAASCVRPRTSSTCGGVFWNEEQSHVSSIKMQKDGDQLSVLPKF